MAFREDAEGRLAAFAGHNCQRLTVDGREHDFADRPLAFVGWAPVALPRRVLGGAVIEVWVQGEGKVTVPLTEPVKDARLFAAGAQPGLAGAPVTAEVNRLALTFEAGPGKAQGKLYLLPAP
ncbi:MAG: hypothetical protein IPM17_01890 [Verrucomicrobia bacterium]|nr:hypothetical protein [Verrucomicrobiota bacterium]